METKFKAYGENAGTFLLFQALAEHPNALVDVLLRRLKGFGQPRRHRDWDNARLVNKEVWLFPNFRKSGGFGEPDALILAEDNGNPYVFWVEVETTVDAKTKLSSLRKSIVQMYRFFLLQQAVNKGVSTVRNSRRIVGRTISNAKEGQKYGGVRHAEVQIKGHEVIKEVRSRLMQAGQYGRDHYVLLTLDRPIGEGMGRSSYADVLRREAEGLSDHYEAEELERLPVGRCWYAYWKADLRKPFKRIYPEFELGENYVRIGS